MFTGFPLTLRRGDAPQKAKPMSNIEWRRDPVAPEDISAGCGLRGHSADRVEKETETVTGVGVVGCDDPFQKAQDDEVRPLQYG